MAFIKQFLLIAVLGCTAGLRGSEAATVKNVVEAAWIAGSTMDFSHAIKFYSGDYVKIGEDKRVFDRKVLENTATYFERIKDPALTFSELVKLNAMLKGQSLTEAQLAKYRSLDATERGKAMVRQTQSQVNSQRNELRQIVKEVMSKYQYGSPFMEKDLAVLFYKLDHHARLKGVLVLRKENGQWKIYREFVTSDPEKDFASAKESEVRKFVNESHEAARNLASCVDFGKYYSEDATALLPDGKRMDYQQLEKQAKFFTMLQNGTPSMAQAAPLFIEAMGKKVTPQMRARFAAQDQSGKGREWIINYKKIVEKYRGELKKSYKYSIQKIFVFEDCALLLDQFNLPNAGSVERISLIKKHQGKYFFHRLVSRKSNSVQKGK